MSNGSILLTVTGPDRPGIVSELTGVLDAGGIALVDIEQVVVRDHLMLGLAVETQEPTRLDGVIAAAGELGLTVAVTQLDGKARPARTRWIVTILTNTGCSGGKALDAGHVHDVSDVLTVGRSNIERITRLDDVTFSAIEMVVEIPAGATPDGIRRGLLHVATTRGCDIALQRESLYRRAKRLVVMDMDSTLIRIEVIDELARAHGVVDRVSQITAAAMEGHLDFDQSLRSRVALLEGLDAKVLYDIAANLPLTDGAEVLVRVLKRLGYRVAVISGGFSAAAEALKTRLGLDYAHSNTLEIVDGKLTGKVLGAIVNAERKAELLEEIATTEGVLLDQVVAVGDGANDALMLKKAGLGIAFRAKQKLREAADTAITIGGLDAILYLLGLTARDIQEVAAIDRVKT